jgi:hypothetical protein
MPPPQLSPLFNLLFLCCFTPVHFLQHPLPKKCTPFFLPVINLKILFLLSYSLQFLPFLNKCANYSYRRIFETSLLTLFGVSLVLWRRKADNAHSNPLFYGPSPLNSQHLHFQFPITSLLKILLEVVVIGRKNAGKDPDTLSQSHSLLSPSFTRCDDKIPQSVDGLGD